MKLHQLVEAATRKQVASAKKVIYDSLLWRVSSSLPRYFDVDGKRTERTLDNGGVNEKQVMTEFLKYLRNINKSGSEWSMDFGTDRLKTATKILKACRILGFNSTELDAIEKSIAPKGK